MLQCGRLLSCWSLNENFKEKKTLSVATEDGSKTSTLRAADTKLAAHQHSASTMHSRGSNCSLKSHQLFFSSSKYCNKLLCNDGIWWCIRNGNTCNVSTISSLDKS